MKDRDAPALRGGWGEPSEDYKKGHKKGYSVLTGFRKYSPEALIKTYNAIAGNNVYHDSPCRSGRLGALNLTLGHLEWERKPPGGSGTNATFEEGTIDWR